MTAKAKPRVGRRGGTVLAWAVYSPREPGCISTSMIFEDRRTAKHVAGTRLVFPVEIREVTPKAKRARAATPRLCASCTTPQWCAAHPEVKGDCIRVMGADRHARRT